MKVVIRTMLTFILLVATVAPQLQAAEIAEAPVEANLWRIKVEAINPIELMDELKAKGFDIIIGSETSSTFEMIVSAEELKIIRARGLKVIWSEEGRPLREIFDLKPERYGISVVPKGYKNYQGIINQMNSIAGTYPEIAQLEDLTTKFAAPAMLA